MDWQTIIGVGTAILTFFGYGHVAAKARQAAELSASSLRAIAREYVARELDAMMRELGRHWDQLTPERIELRVWQALAARKIKRTAAADLLVHELVVVALGKLRRELNAAATKVLPALVGEMTHRAQGVREALAAPPLPEMVRALDGATFERIDDEKAK